MRQGFEKGYHLSFGATRSRHILSVSNGVSQRVSVTGETQFPVGNDSGFRSPPRPPPTPSRPPYLGVKFLRCCRVTPPSPCHDSLDTATRTPFPYRYTRCIEVELLSFFSLFLKKKKFKQAFRCHSSLNPCTEFLNSVRKQREGSRLMIRYGAGKQER